MGPAGAVGWRGQVQAVGSAGAGGRVPAVASSRWRRPSLWCLTGHRQHRGRHRAAPRRAGMAAPRRAAPILQTGRHPSQNDLISADNSVAPERSTAKNCSFEGGRFMFLFCDWILSFAGNVKYAGDMTYDAGYTHPLTVIQTVFAWKMTSLWTSLLRRGGKKCWFAEDVRAKISRDNRLFVSQNAVFDMFNMESQWRSMFHGHIWSRALKPLLPALYYNQTLEKVSAPPAF